MSMQAHVSFQMQIVGKHYSQEASFLVRFGRSKISLDIPESGKVTEEGWRITPNTHPTVSTAYKNHTLLSSFAKDDRSAPVYNTSNVVLMFENQRFSFGLTGLQIQIVSVVFKSAF